MFDIILFQPEIPPNTGNIIRLCANTGSKLHLIKPLGFSLEDKRLLRAGLDYHEFANIKIHENWEDCLIDLQDSRIFAVSTKGNQRHHMASYLVGDAFLFGAESIRRCSDWSFFLPGRAFTKTMDHARALSSSFPRARLRQRQDGRVRTQPIASRLFRE